MIKKVKGGYEVKSESGKNLGGPYKSRGAAEKRLEQVEYFKHKAGSDYGHHSKHVHPGNLSRPK